MTEEQTAVEKTPQQLADEVKADKQAAVTKEAALIASLLEQRASIDAALVALGAKRNRKKAEPKRGRPKGSKNRPAETPEVLA